MASTATSDTETMTHDDATTLIQDPTEHLMELLAAVSAPDTRGEALTSLVALPATFWDRERLEGTLATLIPAADGELPEQDAFALWTLMADLLARFEALTGERAADTFLDMLGGLLSAESAEIRGFAASATARATEAEATALLLTALHEESDWSVAIRLITGLSGRDLSPIPTDILARLLEAPTDEATAWAAHQLGERGDASVRRPLYRALHHASAAPLQDAARGALQLLDLADARRFAAELPEARHTGAGSPVTVLDRDGRQVGVRALFEASRAVDGDPTPQLHVHLKLGDLEADTAERLARLLAGPLAQAAAFPIDAATLKRPDPYTAAVADAPITSSAPYQVAPGDGGEVIIRLALVGQPPITWLQLLLPLLGRIADTLADLDGRQPPSPDLVEAAIDALHVDLQRASERLPALTARFPQSLTLQGADGRSYLLLALEPRPAPLASLIALDLGALTTNAPEAGLLTELYLPDEALAHDQGDTPELRARLTGGLADALRWKFDLPAEVTPDLHPHDPDLSGQLDADLGHGLRILIRGAQPQLDPLTDLARGARVGDLAAGLIDFIGRLGRLVAKGVSLWEGLGLPDPHLHDRLPSTTRVVTPRKAPEEIKPLEVAPKPALRPELQNLWDDIGGFKPPQPEPRPKHTGPSRAQQARSALYEATQSDDDPFDKDPLEVIKNLGADIALADVYLRSTGYNHAKLAQIMAVYLEMDRSRALELIEQAPCLLRSGIPRDRARSIRQVLEGTGAKITVTRHGEDL